MGEEKQKQKSAVRVDSGGGKTKPFSPPIKGGKQKVQFTKEDGKKSKNGFTSLRDGNGEDCPLRQETKQNGEEKEKRNTQQTCQYNGKPTLPEKQTNQ